MTIYKLTNEANQRFIIDYGGEAITILLRYCPTIGSWLTGIEGVCDGVRVAVNVPVFQQYGYNRLFFMQQDNGEVLRDITETVLMYADGSELSDIDFPTVEVFAGAIRLRKNG